MNYKRQVDKKATGLKLYSLIERSRYTREDIAVFLELTSPRVIYDWVNGMKLPTVENLVNLAKLLNVHVEDILVI